MALGKKKETELQNDCFPAVQTGKKTHPYTLLSSFGSKQLQYKLFNELREAVPVVDAALMKLVRLLGTFEIQCGDAYASNEAKHFITHVKTGALSYGINTFVSQYFLSLLTYGTAIGEIVTDGFDINALYVASPDDVRLREGDNPLEPVVCAVDSVGQFIPVKYGNLILTAVLNPEPGELYGTSILKGLPFVADILMKIYNTIGENWERIGNIRYAVTYKPQGDTADKTYAAKRARLVAEQWSKTMESKGPVKDFVAVGDVNIRVIGADNQILDSEVPVRQMLEQIVSKLGIPPYLLGFNWSSTERMSSQQADILTSEIEYYREILNPVINKIFDMLFKMKNIRTDYSICWNDITLQDELCEAQTRYYSAQAQSLLTGTQESEKNDK